MKARIFIQTYENPQDPDMVIHKPPVKLSTKSVSTHTYTRKKIKAPSIASSIGSEDENKESVSIKDEGIDQEIENLFLRVKEECEKDQIKPANFLQDIEEDLAYETKEKIERNHDIVTIERQEKKGNVVITTRTMAPSRYFPEFKQNKAKFITKLKRKEKKLRKKLKNDKNLCEKVLRLVIALKINNNHLQI